MSRWSRGKFELIPNARHDVLYEVASVRDRVISEICALFS